MEYTKAPGFGGPNTGRHQVEEFYSYWIAFKTYKSFKYADSYDARDGQNRMEKRFIEKENEKERKKEKREYLLTIKKLIEFVKKKDPRWKLILKEEEELAF